METLTETDEREETLDEKLDSLKQKAKEFASKHPVATAAAAAAVVVAGAVGAYLLWRPSEPSTAGDKMKAPGSGGRLVSRAAFEENTQGYFKALRSEGADAALSTLKY